MTVPITRNRDLESLKIAARWPGVDQATVVTLATRLAATRSDADGYAYFQHEADAHPEQALPLALAGFFQACLGTDADAALAKLDKAADAELGLPHFFRGLALAALPPDPQRAGRAVADLEFVLAVRDQFPLALLRAVHQALAVAYAVLGKDDLAAEASRRSGLGSLPAGSRLQFGSYWATAEDGFRFTSPRIWRPEPDVHVAQGYDFCDTANPAPDEISDEARQALRGVGSRLPDPPRHLNQHLEPSERHLQADGGRVANTDEEENR